MLHDLRLRMKQSVSPYLTREYDAVAHERLRLRLLFAVALFKMLNFFGGNWDIQWHVAIGRDSLWIPPHLLVIAAFLAGLVMVTVLILYETSLASAGHKLQNTIHLGAFQAPGAIFGVFFGYTAALLSGGFDEWWHETFGIDATLWSPPHLCIMASTLVVDFSLMIGIAISARRLGAQFKWRSPLLWGLALTGAFTFESVNFQMSEALIRGYRVHGVGLMGLLYPILVGALFPLPLVLNIKLSRHFWIAGLAFAVAFILQIIGVGVAAAGFAILKPVSVIEGFIRLNPDSTLAKAREFSHLIGINGLYGFQQAWALALSAFPLVLVSLLELWPRARRQPILAAPLYSASLVLVSYIWFQFMPLLRDYPITTADVLIGTLLCTAAGWVTGSLGLWLANLLEKNFPPSNGSIDK